MEKGQSGNPGGKKGPKKLSRIIEEIFTEEIGLVDGGIKKRVTFFEAILLQLWLKQSQGNRRAMRVLKKYEAFAKTRPEYVVMTDQERKEGVEAYARMLEEWVPNTDRPWDNLTVKQASERYQAFLIEGPTMSDYEVGYGKPPRQHQFKKGVCPNKKGRGKKNTFEAGLIFEQVMNAPTAVVKRGRKVNVPLKEYSLRRCAAKAVKGSVSAAETLLDLLIQVKASGEFQREAIILSESQCRDRGIAAKRLPKLEFE